jgi:hypothetical protein
MGTNLQKPKCDDWDHKSLIPQVWYQGNNLHKNKTYSTFVDGKINL